ncbi:MAG TPA: class I SAM-dependent methyltransferase [Kiritimatiellia bacterium]|nr:class I SAM-dependent methyltransferase [Kiritimatiellia bacterium]HSA18913.1 class I SAM-dependent methyltransferase [Kiritimatiellia bacterium]
MPDHDEIYRCRAGEYEELVSREDHEGNLLSSLEKIIPFRGMDVVDFGAGTGRVTCLLAPLAKSIRAYDLSPAMLEVAAARLRKMGLGNWSVAAADSRRVPAEDASADVAIAGWSLCYIATGNPEPELRRALAEMERVLRPGGRVILIETLGTGFTTPHPPDPLAAYFSFLNTEGFQRAWIRTDYRFRDRAEGVQLARFFFGDETAAEIVESERGVILPECTGLWWRLKP